MEKGGGKILFFVFLFILGIFLNLVFIDQVFCYDTNIAHPGIAGLAVKVYNKNNVKKITAEQYDWIKQGAVAEDTPTRWLNHFYDPVYNRGLWFITQHKSSKVWAQGPSEQQSYSKGDKTWQRAINDYRSGNYESAFKELGHNIHLVSDLLVPAHTRDDIHAPKPDSYEEYVKNNWNSLSKDIKTEPIYKNNLEDIFDEAANYSNNNFYSDSTIEAKNYKVNNIENILELKKKNDKMFLFQSKIGQEIINLYAADGSDWKNYSHKILNENSVLSDYAHHLLPKAVAYSAGTIKLFLDETQKNQTKKLPFLRTNLGGLVDTVAGKFINVAENLYQSNPSQADTNRGVLNEAADVVVTKIETIGKSINKKNVTPTSTSSVFTTSSSFFKISPSSTSVIDTPKAPISTNIFTENEQKFSPKTSIFFGGGGSGSGGGSPSSPLQPSASSNNLLEIITTTMTITTTTSSTISTSTADSVISTSTTSTLSSSTSTLLSTSTIATDPGTTNTSTVSTPTSTSSEFVSPLTTSTIITTSTISTSTVESTISVTSTVFVSSTPPTSTTLTPTSSVISAVSSTAFVAVPDVVINEIAWAGTSQFTPEDEYFELYNNSDRDIDLFPANNSQKWWKLKISGQEIIINKINNSIIPAHGYYLLENPDNRTVNEIDADLIYSGTLSDSGENLQLFDGNNNLVDEVNSSAGWFAGESRVYSSMEKINSSSFGNTPSNWQSNQGPRLTGKVDGGGDALSLNGSPKQPNFGSIVLRSTQISTNRILKKSDYPYILTYYEIPAGKILSIEEGVVIKASYPDSKIDIQGTLNIYGSNTQRVVMASNNQSPKAWQGLMFYPGSDGYITGLDMSYAGNIFGLPNANMWDPKVSRAIYTNNTSLTIADSNFVDNGEVSIYNLNSSSSISNANFKNGVTAVEHHGGKLSLDNIKVDNFSNPTGAIYAKNIWPQLSAINFSSSTNGAVNIALATITSSVTIGSDMPINLENITIESSGSLTVTKGVTFKIPEYSNIFIKGVLNLNGTDNEPIKFVGPAGINQYWGHLVFDGGIGNLNSVDFSGGGYNYPGDTYHGVISANNNSQLTLENCQLTDNRLPVEIIQINNSNVALNNTSIGYSSKNTFFQNVKGVQVNNGSLSVDNSFFYNLTTGITAGSVDPLPQLNLKNMNTSNFFNVDNYWDPFVWWPAFAINP